MKKTEPKAIELCSSAQASLFYTFLEERTSRSLRESQGCYGEKNWKKMNLCISCLSLNLLYIQLLKVDLRIFLFKFQSNKKLHVKVALAPF